MRRNQKTLALVLIIALVSVSCSFSRYVPVELHDVPLETDNAPVDPISNFSGVVTNAAELAYRELPDAKLTSFEYKGPRTGLVTLDGIMYFGYVEQHWGLDRNSAILATVKVDIAEAVMSLTTSDPVAYYGRTEAINLTSGLELSNIALVADHEIGQNGIEDCYVRLLYSDDNWRVICYPSDSSGYGEVLCDFRIDMLTGHILRAE